MNSQHLPLVSIVIPNFNCLDYLPQCLQSIEQQTFVDYEIIFVDDGSTDGSREYLAELAALRPYVSVWHSDRIGPGAARNLAVRQAKGDYIAFLDADDTWTHSKLAEQVAFMRANKNCVMSFTNYQHIDEQDREIIPCFDYWPDFKRYLDNQAPTKGYQVVSHASAALFKENIVGTSSVMCRRDVYLDVEGFDTQLPSASDWDLWLKLSTAGDVAFTTEIRMYYLMRAGSVSSNVEKRIAAMKTIAARYEHHAQQQCANSKRFVDARLMDALCEHASANLGYLKRNIIHVQTFAAFPNTRRFKAMMKTALCV
ncbi:glycosyltransferase family 2 protein [Vibrio sp. SCSIO 43140]|uniref:glycosyltransferase family 2 protein n=1 Tax=Vibrio sp. SCSIO 43140 TaxID=2819100 RepID=UPI0020760796|nr:glycosyltransferase family 2 protein [Vibrio sp. SCSIO 43140]USD61517.1 glycosyltransferase family 2 protein [Vibrio sp. SCSIO 43140]